MLPAITLGLVMAAYITRVTRSAMLQVLGEDYIRTARAKGVPRRRVVWRHGLAQRADAGGDRGRAVYRHPDRQFGADRDRVQPAGPRQDHRRALNQRDYTMLQGLMVIYCFLIVVVNLITDLTYGLIDPRVKHA